MAVSFNGTNNSLEIALNRPFLKNTGGGTLMAWLVQRTSGTMSFVGVFGGTGGTRAKLTINPGGTIQLRARSLDADTSSNVTSGGTIALAALVHVVGVFDFTNATGTVYINGVIDTIGNFATMTAGNTSNTNNTDGHIGSNETGSTNFYDGLLEDVRIYDRALGPGEILTIYTGMGKDGIVTNLQSRWPMSDLGTGNVGNAVDLSNNNFGAISDGAAAPTYADGVTLQRSKRNAPIGLSL
jgi:hypothetical protein